MIGAQQIGVQAHCLRFEIQKGLEQTLAQISRLGLAAIELVRFPGCRGNRWGDFGAATDRPAREIGAAVRSAGLVCPSVMVSADELTTANMDSTIEWVRDTGATRLVLTALPSPDPANVRDWTAAFANLNVLGSRMQRSGLRFAFHPQPSLWSELDGARLADVLLDTIDPDQCKIEFDPSGAIIYGTDAASYLRKRPGAFFAMHLRDGMQPPSPVFYLPSEPLGCRYIDWPSLLDAAAQTGIEWYFLEMEVADPTTTWPAIVESLQFLKSKHLAQPH